MHILAREKGRASRRLLCLAASVMLLSVSVFSVSAEEISCTYNGSFESAWERYASTEDGEGNLTYGYNTWAVHEDYAWASHDTKSHYAAIYNDKGWHTGPGKAAGSTSKIEVTHNGTSINYYLYY